METPNNFKINIPINIIPVVKKQDKYLIDKKVEEESISEGIQFISQKQPIHRVKIKVLCKRCNKEFYTFTNRHYCLECKANKNVIVEKICDNCQKTFSTNVSTRRFCSEICRTRTSSRRHYNAKLKFSERHKERNKERSKAYYITHKEELLPRMREYGKNYWKENQAKKKLEKISNENVK